MSGDYQLVSLANGQQTLFSARYGEKMHPGLGPAAEAEWLYVRQLQIRERLQGQQDEFVIWDVGLGGAANALALLRATRDLSGRLHLVSFDHSSEPLAFALQHAAALGYVAGYEPQLAALLGVHRTEFDNGRLHVRWDFQLVDFPAWLGQRATHRLATAAAGDPMRAAVGAPHAIFYDAFSPAKNPEMWTLPVFADLLRNLDSARPCALTTYSRSTMIRSTLLSAGWWVGVGRATGQKEETTLAANCRELIADPLGARWLERAARSDSAEPMPVAQYVRRALTPATLATLRGHPQFAH